MGSSTSAGCPSAGGAAHQSLPLRASASPEGAGRECSFGGDEVRTRFRNPGPPPLACALPFVYPLFFSPPPAPLPCLALKCLPSSNVCLPAQEWLRFCSCPDHITGATSLCDHYHWDLFFKFDKDGSGCIDTKELPALISELLSSKIPNRDLLQPEMQRLFSSLVDDMSLSVMQVREPQSLSV